jgi:hypothetical protein
MKIELPLKAYCSVSGLASVNDGRGIEIISRMSGSIADEVVKAVNHHDALVAVAKAANNISLRQVGSKLINHCAQIPVEDINDLRVALSALAVSEVAAVKYEEAIFNTKEDAEFWISQERRRTGFHVIESAKAISGFKVVFERRKGAVK